MVLAVYVYLVQYGGIWVDDFGKIGDGKMSVFRMRGEKKVMLGGVCCVWDCVKNIKNGWMEKKGKKSEGEVLRICGYVGCDYVCSRCVQVC